MAIKESTYLAMLARIGLGSPTKSFESLDSINQGGNIYGVEKALINTPQLSGAASLMHLGQHSLSLRYGSIGKDKGK